MTNTRSIFRCAVCVLLAITCFLWSPFAATAQETLEAKPAENVATAQEAETKPAGNAAPDQKAEETEPAENTDKTATPDDTSPWVAHDRERPKPAIVTPCRIATPVLAPSDAIVLFDGDDLSQWRSGDGPAKWVTKNGFMESVPGAGYIRTRDSFGDVQLHVEWAAPVPVKGNGQGRGNSGVFLMGEFEVQVLDSYENTTYADGQAAALYGQSPPLVNASLPPGEWQTYDIVFRRARFDGDQLVKPARMTVLHNGVLVQDNQELWGPTLWLKHEAYPKNEEAPISFQDHGNPVRYRNIWVRKLPDHVQHRRPKTVVASATWSEEQIQSVAGKYGDYDIRHKDGKIELFWGDRTFDLIPVDDNRLAFSTTDASIVFHKTDDQVTSLTVDIMGSKRRADRE